MTTFEHRGVTYNIPGSITKDMGGSWSAKASKEANLIKVIKFYLDNKRAPSIKEMKSDSFTDLYGRYDNNLNDGFDQFGFGETWNENAKQGLRGSLNKFISQYEDQNSNLWNNIKKENPNIAFDEEGNFEVDEITGQAVGSTPSGTEEYNPYTQYLEQQRMTAESQELGLLNEQTRAGQQNAEISAQQSMIQQAQLRDQIVEQIKLDRMSKMRQGITPMQIANESLQFTVGNIQANNQQMTGVNQARLAATQQQGLNPYQAYLNSINGAGYQAQGNVASGMAATDASDMYQQALRYAKSQGRSYIKPEDYELVQGMPRQ